MRVGSLSLGLVPLSLLLSVSCSLVYDLSPDQCGVNEDCEHFGDGFFCENGVCKAPESTTGGTGGTTGGTTSKGGSSGTAGKGGTSGSGGSGGDSGDGGTGGKSGSGGSKSSGGTTGKGGSGGSATSGSGGEAGEEFVPECATHDDCFELHDDGEPYACVNQVCQKILNDDCPVLLPQDDETYSNLRTTDAILLGAYASVPSSLIGTMTQNFDLVMSDFRSKGGLPTGSGSTRRQVVMVVCRWDYDTTKGETQATLLPRTDHMIKDLGIKAILGTLPAADQQYVFEQRGQEAGVFFMMPGYSDETLNSNDPDGLIWNMLAGGKAMSSSMQPLLDMTLEHLRNNGSLGATDPATVFLVQADDERFLDDYGTAIRQSIEFNDDGDGGKLTAAENAEEDHFFSMVNKSVITTPGYDQSDVIDGILTRAPHVVISSGADEVFSKIIRGVEEQWDTRNPSLSYRPFYLVSPFLFNQASLVSALLTAQPGVRTRILGTNWPAAADQALYNEYRVQLGQKYSGSPPGYENFYDAAYYLTYAVAAASKPLTGERVAEGMVRLIGGSTTYDVGPAEMNQALNWLREPTNRFKLIGAMGPPAWTSTGDRTDSASIWCLNGSGGFVADVLRYDAETETLTGTVPSECFTFPAPP